MSWPSGAHAGPLLRQQSHAILGLLPGAYFLTSPVPWGPDTEKGGESDDTQCAPGAGADGPAASASRTRGRLLQLLRRTPTHGNEVTSGGRVREYPSSASVRMGCGPGMTHGALSERHETVTYFHGIHGCPGMPKECLDGEHESAHSAAVGAEPYTRHRRGHVLAYW